MSDSAPRWIGKLRHPSFDELADIWVRYQEGANSSLAEIVSLDQVLGLAGPALKLDHGAGMPYVTGAREAVLGQSFCAFGKAAESRAAAAELEQRELWLASVVAYYEAALFCARAIISLYGFAPFSRDGRVALDLFPPPQNRRERRLSIFREEIVGFKCGRWDHATVWWLLKRLVNTMQSPGAIASVIGELDKVDWGRISDRRNLYSYHPAYVAETYEIEFADIPSSREFPPPLRAREIDLAEDYLSAYYSSELLNRLFSLFHSSVLAAGLEASLAKFADTHRLAPPVGAV